MMTLLELASGRGLVYIVTRLFDYAEKFKAERVEGATLRGLKRAMREYGIDPTFHKPLTFVPFRDTAQDKIKAADKTRIIYEEDMKRLRELFMVVGFLDGLSKDEGVCMEIGYAYSTGVPILVVLTDFIRREFKEVPNTVHLLDPILLSMATRIIHEYKISDVGASFLDRLTASLERVYQRIEEDVYQLATTFSVREFPFPSKSSLDVYIDFGGGHFEWERMLQKELAEILLSKGLSVQVSQRYACYAKRSDLRPPCISVKELGMRDIISAANAKIVVTCGDGDEMSSGTAAIHGFARALNKKVLLYDSRATYLVGDDCHKMSRNLMIDHSASLAVDNFAGLLDAIEMLLQTQDPL